MVWTASYTIEDAKGLTSTVEVNFDQAATFDNARRAAQRVGQLINAITRGAIRKINIAYNVPLPTGLRAEPEANSDVEEGARFQFRTENGFYSGMRLPTFNEALLVANSTEVDVTIEAVRNFVEALRDSVNLVDPVAVIPCVDKRGEDLVALTFAREQFQSSRR